MSKKQDRRNQRDRIQQHHADTREHDKDVLYFAARPTVMWRVRPRGKGEFTHEGLNLAPGATHVLVVTSSDRTWWSGLPLTLPSGASASAIRAVALHMLRQQYDDTIWELMG